MNEHRVLWHFSINSNIPGRTTICTIVIGAKTNLLIYCKKQEWGLLNKKNCVIFLIAIQRNGSYFEFFTKFMFSWLSIGSVPWKHLCLYYYYDWFFFFLNQFHKTLFYAFFLSFKAKNNIPLIRRRWLDEKQFCIELVKEITKAKK
jgi:hypothetical protein